MLTQALTMLAYQLPELLAASLVLALLRTRTPAGAHGRRLAVAGAAVVLKLATMAPEGSIWMNALNKARDEIDAATGEAAEEPTAEVTNFATKGPNALKFAWIAALAQGKSYMAVPSRSADGERWFTGTGKAVAVKES